MGAASRSPGARRVPGATTGVLLEVDDTYLRTAIDLLCGFILGVIVMAWDTLPPANPVYVAYLVCSYAAAAESEQRWRWPRLPTCWCWQ